MTHYRLQHAIPTSLCEAASKGDIDRIGELLRNGHSVNLHDNRGWTPLHEAISHGHFACAEVLLENGSNVNAKTFEGVTPLFLACKCHNDSNIIRVLRNYNVNCNIPDVFEVTPLHIASKQHKKEIVHELLKMGAKVNCQDMNLFTPLMGAIDEFSAVRGERVHKRQLETIHLLLNSGASLTVAELHGRTPLIVAVCCVWEECVRVLLEHGSDVNASTRDGATALTLAAQLGNLRIVELLLDWKARTDIVCNIGTVPLHHALHGGHISIADRILQNMNWDKLLNENRSLLRSFLVLAIDSGSFESFKFVVDNKLFCPSIDESQVRVQETFLNEKYFNHYELQSPLSLLLSLYVDQRNCISMMNELLQLGNSVNVEDSTKLPPLTAVINASVSHRTEVFDQNKLYCFYLLLQKGGNIDYCSVGVECAYNVPIPDAVLAAIVPKNCSKSQNLLLPVLANCFACDWEDLLVWLMRNETCSADVVRTLIDLGITNKNNLLHFWENMKQCPCDVCEEKFRDIFKILNTQSMSLQSLCRSRVRRWLWSETKNSAQCRQVLQKLVPWPVIQEIVIPEGKWKNEDFIQGNLLSKGDHQNTKLEEKFTV